MKIAIINDVHVGKALMHHGQIRASSHLIENHLESILQQIIEIHSPDIFINLGDLIRSEEKETDLKNYSRLLSYLKRTQKPVIHLLGNHELKKMTPNELEQIWIKQNFHQKIFGSKEIGGFSLLWIALALDANDPSICYLPEDQLTWLTSELAQTTLPTLIFSHCPLDNHDLTGNFFYEAKDNRSPKALFLKNQEAVRKIISSSPHVQAVFQAHLHDFHVKRIGRVPYITCPAMGDHLCGPNAYDKIPEIYTILSIDKTHLVAKAYSSKYSFTGYEEHFPS
jgi:hypothetical protein